MREIIFRAWDIKRREMFYIDDLYFFEEEGIHEIIDGVASGHHAKYNIAQCAGLNDKNGKEIYEGDIVKHVMNVRVGTRRMKVGRSYESYAVREDKEIIGVVKQGHYSVGIGRKNIPCLVIESSSSTSYDSYFWGEGKRGDKPTKISEILSEPLFNDKEYEIIGNIYENPELLNGVGDAE